MNEHLNATALSPRETAVMARLAAGRTLKEVAYELGISYGTVAVHVHGARRKRAIVAIVPYASEVEAWLSSSKDPALIPAWKRLVARALREKRGVS